MQPQPARAHHPIAEAPLFIQPVRKFIDFGFQPSHPPFI
nr:MAG TPA: hypothetical protein [Caudoviricetes sp.]